jgi:signal recognition particle GTPase
MFILTKEQIFEKYEYIKNSIQEAINKGDVVGGMTAFDVIMSCVKQDDYAVLVDGNTMAVVNTIYYPNKKTLNILSLTGTNKETTSKNLHKIYDIAKNSDCSGVEITGRKGWVKQLTQEGFTSEIRFYKELEK